MKRTKLSKILITVLIALAAMILSGTYGIIQSIVTTGEIGNITGLSLLAIWGGINSVWLAVEIMLERGEKIK